VFFGLKIQLATALLKESAGKRKVKLPKDGGSTCRTVEALQRTATNKHAACDQTLNKQPEVKSTSIEIYIYTQTSARRTIIQPTRMKDT
jgi:hypothetical protein